jgi:hypothetical protein
MPAGGADRRSGNGANHCPWVCAVEPWAKLSDNLMTMSIGPVPLSASHGARWRPPGRRAAVGPARCAALGAARRRHAAARRPAAHRAAARGVARRLAHRRARGGAPAQVARPAAVAPGFGRVRGRAGRAPAAGLRPHGAGFDGRGGARGRSAPCSKARSPRWPPNAPRAPGRRHAAGAGRIDDRRGRRAATAWTKTWPSTAPSARPPATRSSAGCWLLEQYLREAMRITRGNEAPPEGLHGTGAQRASR